MFIKIGDDQYLCGAHYSRRNELKIDAMTVERILEEKFGGTAEILGCADYKIIYYDNNLPKL